MLLLHSAAGIALLAYGIHITKNAVLKACGSALNAFAARALASKLWPLRAAAAGLVITVLVQSSNAAAMLVSSFLSRGIIALTPALAIMLGADLGTALMARVLTFDLSAVAPIFLIVGVVLFLGRRKTKAGRIGRIFIGLGLVITALKMIVTAASPALQSEILQLILDALNGEMAFAVIFGALLAVLCYSSLAAVLLTALMAGGGHLSLVTALCLVIGANLGSCALEILGSLGQGITARRVMYGNTLFKITIAVIALPLITLLDPAMLPLSLSDQVIYFHVAFNTAVCCGLMPLVPAYARLLQTVFPDKKVITEDESKPMYLDVHTAENPALAISNAVRETLRIGGFLHEMLSLFNEALTGKTSVKASLQQKFNQLLKLGTAVRVYLDRVDFDDAELNARWHQVFTAVISAGHAGDLILRMYAEVSLLNKNPELTFTAHHRADLLKLTKVVNENLSLALNAFMTNAQPELQVLAARKKDFKRLTDKYGMRQLNRLRPESGSNEVGALMLILISELRQLNSIFCSPSSGHWIAVSDPPGTAPAQTPAGAADLMQKQQDQPR